MFGNRWYLQDGRPSCYSTNRDKALRKLQDTDHNQLSAVRTHLSFPNVRLLGRKTSAFCDSSHSALPVSTSLTTSSLPEPTQATDSIRERELKMPPADQSQRLDPGQRAEQEPFVPANNFLAVGPSLFLCTQQQKTSDF